MPIYTVTTQQGNLTAAQKKAVADKIAEIHARVTNGPKSYIHVFFKEHPRGNGFVGGVESAATFLLCQIRAGRDINKKQTIVKECFEALEKLGGLAHNDILVALEDVPASQAMMRGAILPDPIPELEEVWVKTYMK